MKTLSSMLAVAMIASASFAGAALAEGNYYEGVQKPVSAAAATLDRSSTGSIDIRQDGKLPFNNGGSRDNRASDVNSGDYYNGADRPN